MLSTRQTQPLVNSKNVPIGGAPIGVHQENPNALTLGIVASGTRGVWTQLGSGFYGVPCPQSGTRMS